MSWASDCVGIVICGGADGVRVAQAGAGDEDVVGSDVGIGNEAELAGHRDGFIVVVFFDAFVIGLAGVGAEVGAGGDVVTIAGDTDAADGFVAVDEEGKPAGIAGDGRGLVGAEDVGFAFDAAGGEAAEVGEFDAVERAAARVFDTGGEVVLDDEAGGAGREGFLGGFEESAGASAFGGFEKGIAGGAGSGEHAKDESVAVGDDDSLSGAEL